MFTIAVYQISTRFEAGVLGETCLYRGLHEISVDLFSKCSQFWSFSVKIGLCFLLLLQQIDNLYSQLQT